VPDAPGLDGAGILAAAADGRIRALVLLGTDPLAEFPDRTLARAALERIERLIVVGAFPDEATRGADIVLPPTVWGEHGGTTSNLEGRVTRLGRAVTPAGMTMESWRIASELAERLGTDFNFDTAEQVTDEIAIVAAAFTGIDSTRLRSARDGIVVPLMEHLDDLTSGSDRPGAGVSWEPIRPRPVLDAASALATLQGLDVGQVRPPVPLHVWSGQAEAPLTASVDAYSLRLVAGHTLYGSERAVTETPGLAGLVEPDVCLLVSGRDRERVGVDDGESVRVTSPRGTLELPVRTDRAVPPGIAFLAFNRAGVGAAELIDATAVVTDLRVETL
jgi:predicted molibdopterin-dependent oxidoreductase YjgC